MQQAYDLAVRSSDKRKGKDRERRNKKAKLGGLEKGDRVLIRNVEKGGPGKLRSYWEQDIYVVVDAKSEDGIVYAVRKEKDPNAKIRVVHRNMLMDCSQLPIEIENRKTNTKIAKPTVKEPKSKSEKEEENQL